MKRDIQVVKDDIIEMKRLIKQTLIADTDILEALHNPDIDIDSPDEFLDNNIYGFIRIPTTQDTVRNFICFTVDDIEENRFNEVMKIQYIQFNVICHLDDMKTEYGIDRHDLLGYLIRDTFNWTNKFGLQFKLIYNKESTIDSDYYCRTLKFEATKPNALNKARMDNPYDKFRR
ncbi:MAG: hypothetical protein IJ444_01905 [Kiritimatiellae bacterium]|nr:hypothetical protein [Kiritimatiellia bacterium]